MQNGLHKKFMAIALAALALAPARTEAALPKPVDLRAGTVRLGSKTKAEIDSAHSVVALGEGMVLVSSNPGGLGRASFRVTFNGAPIVAKVQGTALLAYLPGQFIEVTGVEGRTYVSVQDRIGETVAVDPGKMLLMKPAARRLPDTVDIDIDRLVKTSPFFNGGLDLRASSLIAKAIRKQSGNKYLKPTPLYFDGAGTVALLNGDKDGRPPIVAQGEEEDALAPLSIITADNDAFQDARNSVLVSVQQKIETIISRRPDEGVVVFDPPRPPDPQQLFPDVAGAPTGGVVIIREYNLQASRGFLEEYGFFPNNDGPMGERWYGSDKVPAAVWLPKNLTQTQAADLYNPPSSDPPPPKSLLGWMPTKLGGLVQGVKYSQTNTYGHLVFKQATIKDISAAVFKITPLSGMSSSQVSLRFSHDDVPGDILDTIEFKKAFSFSDPNFPSGVLEPQSEYVWFDTTTTNFDEVPRQKGLSEMSCTIPKEGVTIAKPHFFKGDSVVPDDTVTQPGTVTDDAMNRDQKLLGLPADAFLGSVYVGVTSGDSVRVEVGDRTRTNSDPNGRAMTFGLGDTAPVFSLQAPVSSARARLFAAESASGNEELTSIESDGPLHISDATPSALTNVQIISKQDVSVTTSTPDRELAFSNARLQAGQGVAVSSPKRIRFENSSQIKALTAIVMQGNAALTDALNAAGAGSEFELVNSSINTEGDILIDRFNRIHMDGAQLMASVIKARALGTDAVLRINGSTLNADKLLRLYAEGSRSAVEFSGAVTLNGRAIDIAGNTVRVTAGGVVNSGANTTVYANDHDYNKLGTGQFLLPNNTAIDASRQKGFSARPPF